MGGSTHDIVLFLSGEATAPEVCPGPTDCDLISPEWIRLDHLMGEGGVGADTAEGRHEFESGSSRRSFGGRDGRVQVWQRGARAMQEVGVGGASETSVRRADPGCAGGYA